MCSWGNISAWRASLTCERLQKRAEASGGFRLTTNNRMEIHAAIKGLELLKQPCKVTIYTDSQYLVNAMTQGLPLLSKVSGHLYGRKSQTIC